MRRTPEKRARLYHFHAADYILIACTAAAILCLFLLRAGASNHTGTYVRITYNGKVYREVSLRSDTTVPVQEGGRTLDIVRVEDGKAWMEYADCPDQICVKTGRISRPGAVIACLPNRVTVTIVSDQKKDFDALSD